MDFEEEETMLQYMVTKMGVDVDRSPKCHAKIIGEGIEYSWGCMKNHHQRILLDKNEEGNFFLNGKRMHIRKIIIRDRVQKFSR